MHGFRSCLILASATLAVTAGGRSAPAHEFVSRQSRSGAYPTEPGTGWYGEAFLNLPLLAAANLLTAETYANTVTPDFTFRTEWIDFPAGPTDAVLDADLTTVRDLLNDYIFEVSDPTKLDEPMSHLLLRFTGHVKVRLRDEVRAELTFVGPPVWVDFGTMGFDGFRTKVAENSVYRTPDVNLNQNPWSSFGPAIEALGLYPITVTYFNRYDPHGTLDAPWAGVELYGYYASDKAWPAGGQMFNTRLGFGTLVPPWVIYQTGQILPIEPGDYDGDTDFDLYDFAWIQYCGDPSFFFLPSGCHTFDLNGDNRISREEIFEFLAKFNGPAMPPSREGQP